MAGQRRPFGRSIGLTALGLLTMAALVLPAPVATATPETDADNAMNQTWEASGGPTSSLGPKDGGVYPVGGEGFGQNYARGKIFFTPATGARIMQGAILDKYLSLGGPADGDLGFPTIDEGPGRVGPDSRNTTFSAGDNPVIFWTPDTGARVVRGAINAAWDKLGGSAGALGVPVEDETYDGDVIAQQFTDGKLSWNRQSNVFTTVPPQLAAQLTGLAVPADATSAINAARRAAGGPLGPLGATQGAQYAIGEDGAGQDFAGGKILFSPATGANAISGPVLAKYEAVGGPLSDLGFPNTSTVVGGLAPGSRISTFAAPDQPAIFWTPDYGAFIVRGAMNAAWSKLGGAAGSLGAPVADQTESGDVVTQRFSGGDISWNRPDNTFSTTPPNLASSLTGLQVPGQEVPQSPPEGAPEDNDKAFTWHWWYWTIALAAVLILGALLVGAFSLRRRRRNRFAEAPPMVYDEDDAHWSSDTESKPDTSEFTEGDVEKPGYSSPRREWSDFELRGLAGPLPGSVREADDLPPDDDSDSIDTTPTAIESDHDLHSGRHSAAPAAALRFPLADARHIPEDYEIKGSIRAGLYYSPDSPSYKAVDAEIWFATEELARANGFHKAQ